MPHLVLEIELGREAFTTAAGFVQALLGTLSELGVEAVCEASADPEDKPPAKLKQALQRHVLAPNLSCVQGTAMRVPRPWHAQAATIRDGLAPRVAACHRLGGRPPSIAFLGQAALNPALLLAAGELGLSVCLGSPFEGSRSGEPLVFLDHLLISRHLDASTAFAAQDGVAFGVELRTLLARAGDPGLFAVGLHLDVLLEGRRESEEALAAFGVETAMGLAETLTASGASLLKASDLHRWRGHPAPLTQPQVRHLATQITERLHPIRIDGAWLAPSGALSVLVQAGAALAAGQEWPATLSPLPWHGPGAPEPALEAAVVHRSEMLTACTTVLLAVEESGGLPSVVRVGPYSVCPSAFLVGLARLLAHDLLYLKIPPGPLPIFDATRKPLRLYADRFADQPPDGARLKACLLEQCWTARPAYPPETPLPL